MWRWLYAAHTGRSSLLRVCLPVIRHLTLPPTCTSGRKARLPSLLPHRHPTAFPAVRYYRKPHAAQHHPHILSATVRGLPALPLLGRIVLPRWFGCCAARTRALANAVCWTYRNVGVVCSADYHRLARLRIPSAKLRVGRGGAVLRQHYALTWRELLLQDRTVAVCACFAFISLCRGASFPAHLLYSRMQRALQPAFHLLNTVPWLVFVRAFCCAFAAEARAVAACLLPCRWRCVYYCSSTVQAERHTSAPVTGLLCLASPLFSLF